MNAIAAMQLPLHLIAHCASDSLMTAVHLGGTWEELAERLPQHTGLHRIVCDIYGTLLQVEPGPRHPESAWKQAWTRCAPQSPFIPWQEMNDRLCAAVRAAHAHAPSYHEVDWVEIFRCLGGNARLARHHAHLQRRCHLMQGAAKFIRHARVPLSLCSNSQAYTLMELRLALRSARLKLNSFDLTSSFFSYQHLTAKPNPEVWKMLQEKLISPSPAALLMVGDSIENDIEPATRAGWSTWKLAGPGDCHNAAPVGGG